ncbi:hypothetical protein BpHYR1_027963 [Brachionus plicatilis]|uniref:Uncharacterized protein n=1 Tax=Brachionus plicatilis TaxID=10195 RepID=A0A3M7QUB0_BRAPC|nr:hypothetical protein BpHYR1_027963 [Brachionus plicatilis]
MDEFIVCFNNLKIEHGFVILSQKNKPLIFYINTKQDLPVTKKFGWCCTYPSCSSTCETNECIVGFSYNLKDPLNQIDEQHQRHGLNELESKRDEKASKIAQLVRYRTIFTLIKEVARMLDDNQRKIIATVRSDVLLKDDKVTCRSSYDADRQDNFEQFYDSIVGSSYDVLTTTIIVKYYFETRLFIKKNSILSHFMYNKVIWKKKLIFLFNSI